MLKKLSRSLNVMIIVLSLFFTAQELIAQGPGRAYNGVVIKGRILDSAMEIPIQYVNIILFSKDGGKQITGTITDREGYFEIKAVKPGIYTLSIKFMGYKTKKIDPIGIEAGESELDLGTLFLRQTILSLKGVEVVDEKPAIEYKIDKKVVNVSKHYSAASGSAVDVLENVPSVTVDIEGNVSLRGSGNFTVLIDGRPTVLEPNDVLQQIPASNIEDIEIITNPSAKFDPEGISGIINIITKKRSLEGINGIADLNGGSREKYGGDFLCNIKREIFNFYFGADYNRRLFQGESRMENETFSQDTLFFVASSGDSKWERLMFGVRGGIDLNIGSRDVLSSGFRYGERDMRSSSLKDYDEWTEPGNILYEYISESVRKHGGNFTSANADYQHFFSGEKHELSARLMFGRRKGDSETSNEMTNLEDSIISGKQSIEKGPSKMLRMRVDYSLPFQNNHKFETGFQSRLRRSDEKTEMHEYNQVSQTYEYKQEYSNKIYYNRNIHSIYSIYSGELRKLGYQGGLRGEYTYRLIELAGEEVDFSIDRWDFFPTIHTSYQFSKGNQAMVSYTRRIDRPRGWYLEPFITWSDAYNVHKGNPDLKPEYIDSYEFGYQRYISKNSFSTELYYRITHNKIERLRMVYQPNVIMHTIDNVGTDYAFGVEMLLNLEMFKVWNANLMGNLYDYRIEGVLDDRSFSRSSFNWSARLSNRVKVRNGTRIQLSIRYHSPSVSSQGDRESFFMMDGAIKQSVFSEDMNITLQVRDIFRTGKYEYTSEGEDFRSFREFTRESPVVMVTLTYNFNDYRPEREREQDTQYFEEEGEI